MIRHTPIRSLAALLLTMAMGTAITVSAVSAEREPPTPTVIETVIPPTCDPASGRHCGDTPPPTATEPAPTATRPAGTGTAGPAPTAPTCDPNYGRHCQ